MESVNPCTGSRRVGRPEEATAAVRRARLSSLMVGVANANATLPATMPAVALFSPTAQVQRPGAPHAEPLQSRHLSDGPRAGGSSPGLTASTARPTVSFGARRAASRHWVGPSLITWATFAPAVSPTP